MKTLHVFFLLFCGCKSSSNSYILNVTVNYPTLDESYFKVPPKGPTVVNIMDNITYIAPRYFEKTHIARVHMNHNSFYDFPRDKSFLFSKIITKFECSHCNISRIDRETLAGLPELSHLDLSWNRIDYIHEEAFQPTRSLHMLNLEHNRLSTVNEKGFLQGLRNLVYLHLDWNDFRFTSGPLFEGSPNFRLFECTNCSITEICSTLIKPYPNLLKLFLERNSVTDLGCLEGNNLKFLDLSHNKGLEDARIQGKSLQSFRCHNCSFTQISAELLEDAPQLSELILSSNRIAFVDPEAFRNNPNIALIRMENNEIRTFPIGAINSSNSLATLCLDLQKLEVNYANTVFRDYYRKKKLHHGCHLHEAKFYPRIEHEDSKVAHKGAARRGRTSQHIVDESNKDFEYFDEDFLELYPGAEVLNISHNTRFHFQTHGPFLSHKGLKEIDASFCDISAVYKDTFSKLVSLETIDLSHNKITTIADFAFEHTNLITLVLDSNQLTDLPTKTVERVPKLTRLSMSDNKDFDFTEDYVFLYHSGIQIFECDRCGVTEIYHDTFSRMTNLRRISLAHNRIEAIETDSFNRTPHLDLLDLNGNRLRSFDPSLVSSLTHLTALCIDDNENFDFSSKEENFLLKELIVERNLSTPRCGGTLKIEKMLPNRPVVVEDVFVSDARAPEMSSNLKEEEEQTEEEALVEESDEEAVSEEQPDEEDGEEERFQVKGASFGAGLLDKEETSSARSQQAGLWITIPITVGVFKLILW